MPYTYAVKCKHTIEYLGVSLLTRIACHFKTNVVLILMVVYNTGATLIKSLLNAPCRNIVCCIDVAVNILSGSFFFVYVLCV